MMERNVPSNWVETTIKEINLRRSENVKPNDFSEEEFELYSVPIFPTGSPEIVKGGEIKSSKQVVYGDEVLLCKINPRINRVWKVGNYSNNRKIASSEWIIIDTKNIISPDFLRYQFSAPFFRTLMQRDVSGVGGSLTRARPKIVENYTFHLPPLPEQKRIVAKLDKIFGRLEVLNAKLDRIPDLLADFRQSVLTQAVTGKLTEDWREGKNLQRSNINDIEIQRETLKREQAIKRGRKSYKHKKAVTIEIGGRTKGILELYQLPKSWQWVSLDQVVWNVSDGPHFSPKYVSKSDGIRFISMRNISYRGIDFSDAKYVSKEDHIEFIKRGKPEIGDVILTKGGTTGIACVVTEDTNFSYWVHLALLKPIRNFISPEYLRDALSSPLLYRQSQAQTHGVANRDLGLTRMIFMALPLPSLEEQEEIIRRVKSLFTKLDAIEDRYQNLKRKIDALPKAILAKAFCGELVPQNIKDEPANDLLKKIQAERERLASEIKAKRRKKKQTIKTITVASKPNLRDLIKKEFQARAFTYAELEVITKSIDYEDLKKELFGLLDENDQQKNQLGLFEKNSIQLKMVFNEDLGKLQFESKMI